MASALIGVISQLGRDIVTVWCAIPGGFRDVRVPCCLLLMSTCFGWWELWLTWQVGLLSSRRGFASSGMSLFRAGTSSGTFTGSGSLCVSGNNLGLACLSGAYDIQNAQQI